MGRRVGSAVLFALIVLACVPHAFAAGVAKTADDDERIVMMSPFSVKTSPLGTVAVMFTYLGEDFGDGQAPIDRVTISQVPRGSPGDLAGLRQGDELLRLNGKEIRGLTVAEFADLIRSERAKGDLHWQGIRGLAKVEFRAVYNGRARGPAGGVAAQDDDEDEGRRARVASNAHDAGDRIERMEDFRVNETVVTVIDVAFVMARENLFGELDDPIEQAKVIDIRTDAASRRTSLRVGDVLLSLNGTEIKGLTLRQLGRMVAEQRRTGLTWGVKRGFQVVHRRFDGPWLRPLPAPPVQSAATTPLQP